MGEFKGRLFTEELKERYLRALLREDVSPLRTICSVCREAGKKNKDPEIQALLAEVHWMAKRMNDKLVEYNQFYDTGWWEAK